MSRYEALTLALEALEHWDVHGKLHQLTEEAITAIKEALAQPEQEQTGIREIRVTETVKQEQELVLQDIEQYRLQMAGISTAAIGYWKESDGILPDYDTVALRDVAELYSKYDALYKARWSAQPEQEPFTYYDPVRDAIRPFKADGDIPLFTTPQKREWVKLTDEQLMECTVHNRFEYDPPYINNVGETRVARHEVALRATYENINSKLKELNT